jgi:hypothetical protein
MILFRIILSKKSRVDSTLFYVEFIPDNEYDDAVKKSDTILKDQIEDLVYLQGVTTELYDLLEEIYGTEFTDKYEL